MRSIAEALQSIAVTLWVGGMWAVGFVVAPVLFARLGDAVIAGSLAGKLFTLVAWLGIACGAYLLLFRAARYGAACLKQGFIWVLVALLILVLAGEFGVHAIMDGLRAQALPKQVMDSMLRDR